MFRILFVGAMMLGGCSVEQVNNQSTELDVPADCVPKNQCDDCDPCTIDTLTSEGCVNLVNPDSEWCGKPAHTCAPSDSPCEATTETCELKPLPSGTVCGGSLSEAQHGECDGVNTWCKWTDYTCKYAATGAQCPNGTCAQGACCQFCVDKAGACIGVKDANGYVISGGVPCP